jgi:two-component system cell cycle response regulator
MRRVIMAKGNILFVEDNNLQGKLMKKFLEERGHAVTWVTDGMSAIHSSMTQSFDVVLLDRILPDMEGNEVCRWLKHNQDTKGIPIIVVSSKDTTADIVQGLDSGADDYISKPYEEVEVDARVTAALRMKLLQDELKQKNDELKDMLTRVETLSNTDPLTGLYNRRRFEAILKLEFKKAMRYKEPLSCIMIDIDNFKAVNDSYGHSIGDAVIKDVAEIIKQSVREVDITYRWGGDEFIVVNPMTTNANAELPARRILESVSDHVFAGVSNKKLTVSIGIADASGPDIETASKLIHAADIKLFEAKKKGRNRIEVDV